MSLQGSPLQGSTRPSSVRLCPLFLGLLPCRLSSSLSRESEAAWPMGGRGFRPSLQSPSDSLLARRLWSSRFLSLSISFLAGSPHRVVNDLCLS